MRSNPEFARWSRWSATVLVCVMLAGGCPSGSVPNGAAPNVAAEDGAVERPAAPDDAGGDPNQAAPPPGDSEPADAPASQLSLQLDAPLTRQAVAERGLIAVRFTLVDPDHERLPQRDNGLPDDGVAVVIYVDADRDGALDAGEAAALDHWIAKPAFTAGENRYELSVYDLFAADVLNGRSGAFFVGVRVTTYDGRIIERTSLAPIVVNPTPPSGVFTDPAADFALRTTSTPTLTVSFDVADPENVLAAPPASVRLVLLTDADADGVADWVGDAGVALLAENAAWGAGSHVAELDLAALPLADEYGQFVPALRFEDAFGRVSWQEADWLAIVDNIAPTLGDVTMSLPDSPADFNPPASYILRPTGELRLRVASSDNAARSIRLYADLDESPRDGDELLVARAEVGDVARAAISELVVPLSLLDEAGYALYIELADAVADPIGAYVRTAEGDVARLRISKEFAPRGR